MTTRPDARPKPAQDTGSVSPLIVGMMLCLLVLGAGVTAAGSAFLAGQRLQHLCDGAVAAAAGDIGSRLAGADQSTLDTVNRYLAVRGADVTTVIALDQDVVTLTCATEAPITFGALFGTRTLHRATTSTAKATYRIG